MPLVDYTRTKRPVVDINLDADPYDHWQEFGKRNKAKLGWFLRQIEELCHDGLESRLPSAPSWLPDWLKATSVVVRVLASGGSRVVGKLAATLGSAFGEDYVAEIRGLAHPSSRTRSALRRPNRW